MYTVDDLVNRGVDITRVRGYEVLARCPFHDDEVPSFAANLQKGVFLCFACGKQGTFKDLGLDGPEKVYYEDWENLLPEEEPSIEQQVFSLPAEYYPIGLKNNYWLYLHNRWVSTKAIKHFEIGYCNDGFYRGRVIVPLRTGFVARSIYSDKQGKLLYGKNFRKYLYPLGLQVSKTLFNFNPEATVTFLVEGVFDALRLYEFGIQATAILGSHISETQIQMLCRSQLRGVVICMDGDEAGRVASEAIADSLVRYFKISVAKLPSGTDPGDLDKDGIKSLKIENYKKVFDFAHMLQPREVGMYV